MSWKATGIWAGHYSYEPAPGWSDLPPRVGFGMRLKQSWLFRSLTGDVWDDSPDGMPGRGVVDGRASGGGVVFLKRMPVLCVWWGGRQVPYAEYLLKESGLPVDGVIRHPPIKYTGEYDPATDELAGTWEIAPVTVQFLSRGQLLASETGSVKGRWSARRQSLGRDDTGTSISNADRPGE